MKNKNIMKYIELTQEKYAIVDDENYIWLKRNKWTFTQNGKIEYAARYLTSSSGKRIKIYMHQEIIPCAKEIDHINGNGLDNRKENLRSVTRSQNNLNRHNITFHSSKYTGVCFSSSKKDRNLKKWRAYIKINGKLYNLGKFNTEFEAHLARKRAERRLKNGLPAVDKNI